MDIFISPGATEIVRLAAAGDTPSFSIRIFQDPLCGWHYSLVTCPAEFEFKLELDLGLDRKFYRLRQWSAPPIEQ